MLFHVGAQHPTAPNRIFIYSFPGNQRSGAVRPTDHKISLWEATFIFDEEGKVYHSSQPGRAVGELTITAPTTEAEEGAAKKS
jgi:hypothetical protein